MKWFQVDSDTPHDPKMRTVIRACGLEGFGALVLLWCHIADHGTRRPGWSIDTLGRPMPLEDLVDATRLTSPRFLALVEACVDSGHFLRRPWAERKIIAIPAMARRADTYTQRKIAGGSRQKIGQSGLTRLEIFARDAYTCHYCRKTRPEPRLEVTRRDRSGPDDAANLTTACKSCNRKKRNDEQQTTAAAPRASTLLVESTQRRSSHDSYKTTHTKTKQMIKAAAPAPRPVQDPADNVGIITKIAHQIIDELGLEHPDIVEATKALCARHRVAYDSGTVGKAIDSARFQRQRQRLA